MEPDNDFAGAALVNRCWRIPFHVCVEDVSASKCALVVDEVSWAASASTMKSGCTCHDSPSESNMSLQALAEANYTDACMPLWAACVRRHRKSPN